jgi:hypothetical protein
MLCNARSVSFVVLCLICNYFFTCDLQSFLLDVYPHGPRRVSRVQWGRGVFSPDWLVGAGAGISNRGGDGERPPSPPHPVTIPRWNWGLWMWGTRRNDKVWSGLREGETVRVCEVGPAYKNRVGPPAVPRWQPAPGLSYRAGSCSDRDKKSGFWAGFRATSFLDIYRSSRVGLGYRWMKVNVERTMRWGGEIVRG